MELDNDDELLTMNIDDNVNNIKKRALLNKKYLKELIEGLKIKDNLSLNEIITKYILENEDNKDINYVYWLDGGFSWFFSFDDITNLSEEELSSLTTGYFRIHYIYNNYQKLKIKIQEIYKQIENIKKLLLEFNINTDIIINNITINTDGTFNFIYDTNTLFKEPSFNIRLIINNDDLSIGGAKFKRKNKKIKFNLKKIKKIEKGIPLLRILTDNKIELTEEKIEELIKKIKSKDFNKKTILSFYFEYFHENENKNKKFNIDFFKETYLKKNHFFHDLDERFKLNKLNNFGLMTYNFLNISNIEDEFGLNVDRYRQEIFIKKYKLNKIEFFENLLKLYEIIFSKFKSYNCFFVDKINELINNFKDPHFETFKDVIDKWFVSKFRPSINYFIIEINKELKQKFNVCLFIAGGDAMRRYENDISFTKDIDTKLYINNIEVLDTTILNEIKDLDINQQKLIIKDKIVEIIVRHIVKLRNYLEEKIIDIFYDFLQYDKDPNKPFGTAILTFKTSSNEIYKVDILLDDENKLKFQQFRTRENKKRIDFPVDLYSIDFRTSIVKYNEHNQEVLKKNHDISILDVVLQDTDDFKDYYYKEIEGIPVASLKFLLEDFYKTYNTDDRALARISSNKVIKDISRFNKIKDLYIRERNGTLDLSQNKYLIISNIDDIINEFEKSNIKDNIIINNLLINIQKKQNIDLLLITEFKKTFISDKNVQLFISKFPNLKLNLIDMIFFKKNFFNEDLSLINQDISLYKEDDDFFRQNYYTLFSKLCSINNKDGAVRHVIMFYNPLITSAIKKIGIDKSESKSKSKAKSKAKPKAKSQSKPKDNKRKRQSSPEEIIQPIITTRSGRISKQIVKLPPKSLPNYPRPPNYPPPPLPPKQNPSQPPNYPPPPLPPKRNLPQPPSYLPPSLPQPILRKSLPF